jgi:hypothetical protein
MALFFQEIPEIREVLQVFIMTEQNSMCHSVTPLLVGNPGDLLVLTGI